MCQLFDIMLLVNAWGCLGSDDDSLWLDCSVILFKVNALMSLHLTSTCTLFSCFENHTDPHVCGSILQQPESRPCRNEPWSQEANAGAVPQHEQAWGHQWAADKVSFFCRCILLTSRPDVAGLWACWLLHPKNYFVFCLQGGKPVWKRSGTRWRAQHNRTATGLLRPRQHGVAAECCPPDRGGCLT